MTELQSQISALLSQPVAEATPGTKVASPEEISADAGGAFPLVPFEHYMLLDDRPDFPMVFVFRLIFRGQLDRAALDSAIQQATARHSLLHSRLVRTAEGKLAWQPVKESPQITWNSAPEDLSGLLWRQVDLFREIGVHVFAQSESEQTRVYFRVHHACCDGMGAYVYFEDILSLYDGLASSPPQSVELRTLDHARLLCRGDFGAPPTPPPVTRRWSDFFGGAWESVKFLMRPPRPLAPDKTLPNDTRPPDDGFITHRLPEAYLPVLRREAEKQGASLNDLLLRDLFLTFREWNRNHAFGSVKSNLQIMMPTGLREAGDKEMPAANVMSYAFLLRSGEACDQPDELLASLANETKAILRYRYPLLFIGVISHMLKAPFAFKAILNMKRCFGTAVLTNLGDPTRRFLRRYPREGGKIRVGGTVLEEIIGIPPLRPLTRAVFSASAYAGGLEIGLRCDPEQFSPAATEELLRLFSTRLKESATTAGKPAGE